MTPYLVFRHPHPLNHPPLYNNHLVPPQQHQLLAGDLQGVSALRKIRALLHNPVQQPLHLPQYKHLLPRHPPDNHQVPNINVIDLVENLKRENKHKEHPDLNQLHQLIPVHHLVHRELNLG
jgi:hypothetical protein